jgi:hypothetical protein
MSLKSVFATGNFNPSAIIISLEKGLAIFFTIIYINWKVKIILINIQPVNLPSKRF